MTLSITILYIQCHYAECCYAQGRNYFIAVTNVIMLSVIMLNVVAPIGKYEEAWQG
jgi:hypothetical protein